MSKVDFLNKLSEDLENDVDYNEEDSNFDIDSDSEEGLDFLRKKVRFYAQKFDGIRVDGAWTYVSPNVYHKETNNKSFCFRFNFKYDFLYKWLNYWFGIRFII